MRVVHIMRRALESWFVALIRTRRKASSFVRQRVFALLDLTKLEAY